MDQNGVAPKDLSRSIGEHPGNAVHLSRVFSYRAKSRVAVEPWLEPTQGMQPWRAARAELVGPGHRTLRVQPPWQREPLRFNVEDPRVVIEAEATEAETRGSFTLKVWNEKGTRSVIISGVTFS